jgi:hypothetical protein
MMVKKSLAYLVVLVNFLSVAQLTGAQTADIGDLSMKLDIYEGISEPLKSEAAALIDARNDAYRNAATSIWSFVTGRYDIKQINTGTNPLDVIFITSGNATLVTRLPLTGVKELEKTVEKNEAGYYKARIQIVLSAEGREKALKYLDQEAMAFRAYNYFAKKYNFAPLPLTATPEGYVDYTNWLDINSLTFSMMEEEGSIDFLAQLDTFLRKFCRAITVFTDKLDNRIVKIMYNVPDLNKEIVTALQQMDVKVYRENVTRLKLVPDIPLETFRNHIQAMPDAGLLAIAGISSNGNSFTHMSPEALNEVARIAGQIGMRTQILRLPDQCLNGAYDDAEIVNLLGKKNARYTILLKSISVLEPAITAYRIPIPAHHRVSYRCALLDSLTARIIYSDTVSDVDFSSGAGGSRITADLETIVHSVLGNL